MTTIHDPRHHAFALNHGGGGIPALGFGTLVSDSSKTRHATVAAIEAGFRHLDCAERYRNEAEVGAALKDLLVSGAICREDLFVTTKLWNNNHRPDRVKPALQASLGKLGLESVDLYLVHTPVRLSTRRRPGSPPPARRRRLRRRGHPQGNLGGHGRPCRRGTLARDRTV